MTTRTSASASRLRELDRALLRIARTRGHSAGAEKLIQRYSRLGEHGFLWYVVAAVGAAVRPADRAGFIRCAGVTGFAFAANQLVKFIIRRPRPVLEDLPPLTRTLTKLSYPSAHATTSFAAARNLSELLPPPPVYTAAIAMALSRLYVGVHYPSDVLAGAALGDAIARGTR